MQAYYYLGSKRMIPPQKRQRPAECLYDDAFRLIQSYRILPWEKGMKSIGGMPGNYRGHLDLDMHAFIAARRESKEQVEPS